METVELKVEGMDCEGCVKSVTRMLSGVSGVKKVEVSLAQASAKVTYDPAMVGFRDAEGSGARRVQGALAQGAVKNSLKPGLETQKAITVDEARCIGFMGKEGMVYPRRAW